MKVKFIVDEVYIWLDLPEVAANLSLCKKFAANSTYYENLKCWHAILKREEFNEFIQEFKSPCRFEGEGLDRAIVLPQITKEVEEFLRRVKDNFVF